MSPPDQSPADRPFSHVERYTNADISMEGDGRLLIYHDRRVGQPPVLVLPGTDGYDNYLYLARGLTRGERKRLYISNGWYVKNDDGTFTTEGFSVGGGAGLVSRQTVGAGDPSFACMSDILSAAEIGRQYPFLVYERDQIEACVYDLPAPPAP